MYFVDVVRAIVLLPFISLSSHRGDSPTAASADTLRLTLATLHAASLTAPRAATDSVDGPYFVVSILGPRDMEKSIRLPESGHLLIHQDEALGARPLVDLNLSPGDTVRVLVSVLLSPFVAKDDPRPLGSATLLLTNEGGTMYWRALECVETCKVLSGSAATNFAARGGRPVAGVVELSGSGATYHMQLQAQRTL
jgi:hypothetical protein